MNWEALGAVGEIFGATATVVMLVYLSIQIRHARDTTQSSTELEASKLLTRLTERVSEDRNLQRIWNEIAEDRQDISEEDISHFIWHLATILHAAEGVWEQFQKGLISKRTWGGWQRAMSGVLRAPIANAWWSQKATPYSNEFYDYIEHEIQKNREFEMPSTQQWMAASNNPSDN